MFKKHILLPLLKSLRAFFLKFDHNLVKTEFDSTQMDAFLARIYPRSTGHDLIRIGADNDAGYLVPDDLKGISVCFSPGVDYNASFEKQLFDNYGIKSYMCDYSVEGPPVNSEGFEFIKKYLNSYEDEQNMTLENWVNSIEDSNDYILQMDIERGEYDVITQCDKAIFNRFRIIIIEFHEMHLLFSSVGFRSITSVFDKLLENFVIVHAHPNNDRKPFEYKKYRIPYAMEYTFLRKDRISEFNYAKNFPHPLDMDNYSDRKSFPLPKIFYKN